MVSETGSQSAVTFDIRDSRIYIRPDAKDMRGALGKACAMLITHYAEQSKGTKGGSR